MSSIVIHPGYPKAASSWLQDHLWGNAATGLCAPWARPSHWGAPADLAEQLFVRVEDADFDPAQAMHALGPGLEMARSRGLVPVLSHELLIDRPNGLGGWAEPVARRLAATFPDARVVIVVREQRDAIISSFRHHIETGGKESMRDFVGRGGALVPLRIAHLRYDVVVDAYDQHFGAHNVGVVPFEMLRVDVRGFAEAVLRAAGVDAAVPSDLPRSAANKGSTASRLHVQRLLNRFAQPHGSRTRPQTLRWRGAVKVASETGKRLPGWVIDRHEQRLQHEVASVVGDMFARSNARLASRTGVDLQALGYDVP